MLLTHVGARMLHARRRLIRALAACMMLPSAYKNRAPHHKEIAMNEEAQKEEMTKVIEESIKTLQQFYATIVAVALASGVSKLVDSIEKAKDTQQVLIIVSISVAFISTIVPFYHGMNRHLYETHIRKSNTGAGGHPIPLLVDIFGFIFESGLLFAMGRSLDNPQLFLILWMALLILDIIWSLIVWKTQKSKKPLWAWNNFIWLSAALVVWVGIPRLLGSAQGFRDFYGASGKVYLIAAIEVCRSYFDYKQNWSYYFPWVATHQSVKIEAERDK